jgi:PIN domain nuclease of toxin-antitoxin system
VSDALLLDTNIVIWTLSEPSKISATAKRAMNTAPALSVSTVTVWEIILKHQAGKLLLSSPVDDVVNQILYQSPWSILPMRPEHLLPLVRLPMIHKDPFDRLLVAQTLHERMSMVTSDENLAKYDVQVVW